MIRKSEKWTIVLLVSFFLTGHLLLHGQQTVLKHQVEGSSNSAKELKGLDLSRFSKSDFFLGGNISFGGTEGENDFVIANVDLIDVDKQNIKLSFIGGYFLNPLLSVGYRGKYSYVKNEQTLEADFLNISFNATTYRTQVASDRYESHFFIRNYVPIGQSGKFYLASETSVYYLNSTSYQRAIRNPGMSDESISTILSNTQGFGAGLGLGFTYFTAPKLAFEIQLGPVGLEYRIKNIEKDKVDKGQSRKFTFRDGLNVLNVQIGFTYYFFKGNKKPSL
ncbi:MAG: hypothetical protein KBH01_01850 [Breznakibacter sp.]|nr:hypothetical protein [Breznakibacter sp.]